MKKLAIITTHPIQYNAPLFSLIHKRGIIAVKVFYTWGSEVLQKKYDPGFDRSIEWDIPLLEGYDYEFLKNTAKRKGSDHFNGIINPGIIGEITLWQPDAVLIYGWKFRSHLRAMRHFKDKIPVWFRGDSVLLNKKKGLQVFFKELLLKFVYRDVDVAFYTGTHNKAYFETAGLKPSQLVRALHAVDNDRFRNDNNRYTEAALKWRKEMGISDNDIIFLFAGKLIPTKDAGTLLGAFKKIGNSKMYLVIIGNGPEESQLKQRYEGLKNLHFVDFKNQAEMPVIYQACEVFILPSIGETWGLSLNEAMASGKAIIASDKCGGAIDLIEEGKNGYIFEAGNVEDLKSKMEKITSSREALTQMQIHSLKKINEFSFLEFALRMEDLIGNDA